MIFFITGMIRSGTTLLGKVLGAHSEVEIFMDYFLPLFKFFRSQKAQELDLAISVGEPLGDYYFDLRQLELLRAIQRSCFDDSHFEYDLDLFQKQIKSYSYHKKVPRLRGNTYKEILESMVQSNSKVVGIKEVWTNEFVPTLLKTFPEMKVIQIIRDPRAVLASKNAKPNKYPWLWMARQWRKLAAITWQNQKDSNVYTIRFEDLIRDPHHNVRKLCDFLRIDFDEKMLDFSLYLDDVGRQWMPNTSFGGTSLEFDTRATERWKKKLSSSEIEFIEKLCWPEASLFGYQRITTEQEIHSEEPRVESRKLADWIWIWAPNDPKTLAIELEKERMRRRVLLEYSHVRNAVAIQKSFLFKSLLFEMRENNV